ncbi:hypothetical protein MTR_5g083390 [Medicago truncatula]|uniref:Non-specific serine/threonine protein kinase n=1 Tax=Medicago truncatula TaxID=3880 RepID=G7K783_MEDTR|nr:hypothetical protein MTR_5g083390 [Medicago truncatula]
MNDGLPLLLKRSGQMRFLMRDSSSNAKFNTEKLHYKKYNTILESLVNSTKLYRLNLSFNKFSIPIPTISFDNLHSLSCFNVSHNNVSGLVPTIGHRSSSSCPSPAPSLFLL